MKEKSAQLWNFDCPDYDKRSSNAINAGTHHGVGKRQPVGSESHKSEGPIKFGKGHQMKDDERG